MKHEREEYLAREKKEDTKESLTREREEAGQRRNRSDNRCADLFVVFFSKREKK
jgi:hypothetical protein